MATKIEIPESGNAKETPVRKDHKVYWAANGKNSYDITLPPNAFVEYPDGHVISADNGGDSETVTVAKSNETGSTIKCTFQRKPGSGYAGAADTTQSGQSDIIVDP